MSYDGTECNIQYTTVEHDGLVDASVTCPLCQEVLTYSAPTSQLNRMSYVYFPLIVHMDEKHFLLKGYENDPSVLYVGSGDNYSAIIEFYRQAGEVFGFKIPSLARLASIGWKLREQINQINSVLSRIVDCMLGIK